MAGVVADTHALVWFLSRSPQLSSVAFRHMQAVMAAGEPILVPTISLVELTYLVEKGRLPGMALDRINEHLDQAESGIKVVPLDIGIARTISRIPRDRVPDMPDRIIAATALHLGLPLVSRDGKIQLSMVETIW